MADEQEKNESAEEQAEDAAEEQPDAAAEEQAEAAADEQAVEEPPAADAAPAEEAEELTPKQRRKRERSRASGPPGPQLDPEQRAEGRSIRRRSAAQARIRHRAGRRQRKGEPRPGTPPAERAAGKRKVRLGTVVSSSAPKTITVRIERARRDTTYEKVVRRSNTVHAHDERDEASEGDVVRVVETRPLSRTKRWRLVEIVERAR